jgi:ubiquinone/menaquinone biosynthesis C-methylase UbiE
MVINSKSINSDVKKYWEITPCGTDKYITGDIDPLTIDWYEKVESYRYSIEPFIHSIAQFTRYRGKRVLEIGVGAGTDHLQWARANTDLYGVDLTEAAIEVTRRRLELYDLNSNLQKIDAETLPFPDGYFDAVYSWGVIHHSNAPELIIGEIFRVLKTDGEFIGMLYQRPSLTTLRVWIKFALLKLKPWKSFKNVLYNHVESIGTKAYTVSEVEGLFANFRNLSITPLLTAGDTNRLPQWLISCLPNSIGWFLGIRATKKSK